MEKLSLNQENLIKLIAFRRQMNVGLSDGDARRIFGDGTLNESSIKEQLTNLPKNVIAETERKLKIAEEIKDKIQFFDWVEYVGVSGSVAAGTVKKEDDIDLFIVTKNHRMWLYRGILLLKTKGFSKRVGDENDKDKLCLNFFSEHRGLKNLPKDMFTFHELMFMKTLYGDYENLLSNFEWLDDFGYSHKTQSSTKESIGQKLISYLLYLPNLLAMIAQYLFMTVMKHNPDYSRLITGFRRGCLELYHEGDFKQQAMKNWDIELKKALPASASASASTTAAESTSSTKSTPR